MGNWYKWDIVRNNQIVKSGKSYFAEPRVVADLSTLSTENRYFWSTNDAALMPVKVGGTTYDFAGGMLYIVPSDVYTDTRDFLETNMGGQLLILGTDIQTGDKLLFENGSGYNFFSAYGNRIGIVVYAAGVACTENIPETALYEFAGSVQACITLPFVSPDLTETKYYYFQFNVLQSTNPNVGRTTGVFLNAIYPASKMLAPNTAYQFLNGMEPVDMDDPYPGIDDSEPSGPSEGTGIPENDPVDIPGLPTVSAIDTGFVSVFNPTLGQVKQLADYMWNNSLFDINAFKKIFENPMDCILGFNIVPVNVPVSGTGYVCVGNLVTTIELPLADSQWVEVDCGSVNIGLPYGNYLDYSPSTKFSIYLPYIGIKELSTDDVAGKNLHLVYHVDILSCACVAYLKCGDSVLYQFAGSCGYSIPVTGNDFARMISSIVDIGLSVGGAVAGGNGLGAVGSVAKDVMGLKPDIHRSGSIGSSTGLMGLQKPYLIVEMPNACKPKKQYHYLGYPSFVTVKLSDISGFASFENVLLEGIPCTDAEREIILSMCKGGIYL